VFRLLDFGIPRKGSSPLQVEFLARHSFKLAFDPHGGQVGSCMLRLGLCLGWVYSLVKLLLPISLLMWTRYCTPSSSKICILFAVWLSPRDIEDGSEHSQQGRAGAFRRRRRRGCRGEHGRGAPGGVPPANGRACSGSRERRPVDKVVVSCVTFVAAAAARDVFFHSCRLQLREMLNCGKNKILLPISVLAMP
jgi:hypothetical protein